MVSSWLTYAQATRYTGWSVHYLRNLVSAGCEITDPVGPSCHLRVGDGQGDPNDQRSARDSSQKAHP